MNDSSQIPSEKHGNIHELSTPMLRQTVSFNTDFNCSDSDLTTESFSDQVREISQNSHLNRNDETEYSLPPFQSTFIKKISLNVVPSTSYNENYLVPNLSENFQFVNYSHCIDNEDQISIGPRHNYNILDVSNNIEPANLLELQNVYQQKESPVNASSTHQLEEEVETRKKTFLNTSVFANENCFSDILKLEVPSNSRTKKNICPDCGNAFTPKTKIDQHNVVLNGCSCKRNVFPQISSNNTMCTHTEDVNYVPSPSHSQLFISEEKQKSSIKNCNLKRIKLVHEINTFSNNEHEVAISSGTHHHKHADVLHKPYVKRHTKLNSSFRTSRDNPGNSSRDDSVSEVASSSVLNRHICQECGKAFRSKTKLHIHLVVHTGDKPFVCDICQKAYSQKDKLNIHNKTHHPETFRTPRVNSSFITSMNFSRENLESAVASSSELKRHICQECGKAFNRKDNLDRHSVVHTGEKPFVCDICQKAYSRKDHLNNHKRNQHPETFKSDVC